MDDVQIDLWKHYPLGDTSIVPVGVDEERYNRRFLEESKRLFVSQGESLEIIRILSENGGNTSHSQRYQICQGD